MMGITGVCSKLVANLVGAVGVSKPTSPPPNNFHLHDHPNPSSKSPKNDDLMLKALTCVFGMQNNGRIKKERARQVVEQLGLIYHGGGGEEEEKCSSFQLADGVDNDDELPVEEVIEGLEDGSDDGQLLQEAFKIFDEDGNGFIEAMELKRVLQCLGLDKGWDMSEIEKMLKVVDLNLDGKVDFSEFKLMMSC